MRTRLGILFRECARSVPGTCLKHRHWFSVGPYPQDEVLVEEYLCALYKKILLQGRMYLFSNYVCFYSNVFGYQKKKVIALKNVTIINKAKVRLRAFHCSPRHGGQGGSLVPPHTR